MSELIVNKLENLVQLSILEENKICEFYNIEEDTNIMGNIYLGRVRNVVDGMQAAFVDIGMDKNSFISLKDALPKMDILKESQVVKCKISDVVKENSKILVQVKKVPVAEKGARVSTHITLPGDYLVLMPNTDILTISQKIENEEEKDRLLNIIKEEIPADFGVIVRTDAEGIEKIRIREDLKKLLEKWEVICDEYNKKNEISLLYNEHEMIPQITRELVNKRLSKIYTNDKKIKEELDKNIEKKSLSNSLFTKFIDTEDIIGYFGLISEREAISNRKIWLKSGGYIVIDKTEALTAIDVNSGKYIGNNNLEQTALEVNKEAAKEIMKQIRLKDIGGIIVIDYIDLHRKEDQEEIIKIMMGEEKKDRSKIDIKGYTELNLVELTRKKVNI